jgi:hypothetical protein
MPQRSMETLEKNFEAILEPCHMSHDVVMSLDRHVPHAKSLQDLQQQVVELQQDKEILQVELSARNKAFKVLGCRVLGVGCWA